MQPSDGDELLPVGVVVGIHGLRGDLKVRPLSGESTALDAVTDLFLQGPGTGTDAYRVERAARHKGYLLIRLAGIASAESAERLVGRNVLIARRALGELADDEYYWFELEGLRVIDRQLGELGTVDEIFTTPAHDILVVQGRCGEVLIPVVDTFIVAIDEDAGVMHVDLPEGLVPETPPDAL